MRNHGWQLPYHPLQTVAIAVFSGLGISFYVFFAPFLGSVSAKYCMISIFTPLVTVVFALYIICAWIDPADPGVHRDDDLNSMKAESSRFNHPGVSSKNTGQSLDQPKKDLKAILATKEDGREEFPDTGCKPLDRIELLQKPCCKRKRDSDGLGSEEQSALYCSICDAEISKHSKHCRACDKCVHGFDHHCRWLNNCVGTRNYNWFIALMVACLLMLVLQWTTGIVVLERCFVHEEIVSKEIASKLGSSFSRVPFIVVVVLLTALAMLATAPLTQLFCFHLILMHKGISTYDYILAVREQDQEFWEGNGGMDSLTTSPYTSTETGFSGYTSPAGALALQPGVFCTPPRLFVDQDQTIMALSDLEVGAGKAGAGKHDLKSQQKHVTVSLNPWKLARISNDDAARAAARARQNSSIFQPSTQTRGPSVGTESDSSCRSSLSTSGEIRVAGRRSRKKYQHGSGRDRWSLMRSKRDRIIPLSAVDAFAPRGVYEDSKGLPPLPPEAYSTYRASPMYFADSRALQPAQCHYPPQFLFPKPPMDIKDYFSVSSKNGSEVASPDVLLPSPELQRNPNFVPAAASSDLQSARLSGTSDVLRLSAMSDGYEASCGESGDDTSDAGRLSQSWSKLSFYSAFIPPASSLEMESREEVVKPWVDFSTKSTGAGSSESRIEATILKQWPELRDARLAYSHSSSPTITKDSPQRESSDFQSVENSASETPDRTRMNSFFYNGPSSVKFKSAADPHVHSSRQLKSSILGGFMRGNSPKKTGTGLLDQSP